MLCRADVHRTAGGFEGAQVVLGGSVGQQAGMAQVDGDALIQRDWLPEQLIDLPLSPFGVLDVVAPGDDAESVDQVVVDNGQRVGNVALDNSPGVGDTE